MAATLPSPQHAAQRASLAAGSSDRTPQLCLRFLGTWERILSLIPSACLPSWGSSEILPRFQGFLLRTWAAGAERNHVPINKANHKLAATHLTTTKTCWFLKKLTILSILKKHLPHAGTWADLAASSEHAAGTSRLLQQLEPSLGAQPAPQTLQEHQAFS